jgi:hypothetical protein
MVEEIMKLSLTVASLIATDENETMVACMVVHGGACVCRESGVRR